MRIKFFHNWLTLGILIVIFISGCTSMGQVQSQAVKPVRPEELPAGSGWWHVRFHMNWPADTEPVWHMDLYLAHQVILPLLKEKKKDISLWRFHRRSKRDGEGRRFTFWFYATPATAQEIFDLIRLDPIVIKCMSAGIIDEVKYDSPAQISRPNIEDTSDKSWPDSIQKTWPYYIDGVSQMWLNLVAAVADQKLKDNRPTTIEETKQFYSQVNKDITGLWQKRGRHAFLHHLNAVFGYEPLIYWEKHYMSF